MVSRFVEGKEEACQVQERVCHLLDIQQAPSMLKEGGNVVGGVEEFVSADGQAGHSLPCPLVEYDCWWV